MEKILNWKEKEARAKKMTVEELEYAINDCVECVKCKVDEGYYSDEASVYRAELKKRLKNEAKNVIREGIKSGDIKIKVTHKCTWCGKVFDTVGEYLRHRVDGKVDKSRKICPHKCQEFGKVTAKEIKQAG